MKNPHKYNWSRGLTLMAARIGVGAIAFCGAISLLAELPPSKSLPIPELKYQKYKLGNGLEVITHEDHRLPLVAVDLWYHVGPVNEKAGRTGFAHLFEHMMFEGSEHVGEKAHIKYLEGAGATDINGTTNFDRTNYFETLPSSQLELALWLESDRMGFLLENLDREKLTNQRDVVRNERRQGEGTPYDLADEEVFHQLYPKEHPYYASVIGSHADIEAARLSDIRDFFKHYYTPNNASIAIAGDFDPAKLRALLEKYFGSIPAGPSVDKVTVKTPAITSERRATITDTVQLPRVSVAWLAPAAFEKDDAESDLYVQILGVGKSSRLYRKLVYEQQTAQTVDCSYQPLRLGSVAGCDITARPGVKPEDLEAAVTKEIEELRTKGPTKEELERARNKTLTGKVGGLQRLGGFGGVADMMDYYNQYLGDPGYLPKDIARYEDATIAGVKEAGQKYFGKNQRVVVYAVPGKKVVNDVPRSPADTDATVKAITPHSEEFEVQQQWRKSAPRAGARAQLHLPVPTIVTLKNGLQVYLVQEHSLPIISASLVDRAGNEGNPTDRPGLAGFTARMLTEGTETRSSTQLANDAASIGAELDSIATMDSANARIVSLSNSTDAALSLLSDVVLHPAFNAEEVERTRTQRLTAILQEADQPIASTIRVGLKVLYGQHPYGFREIGTTESVKILTREELVNYWAAHYAPQQAALIICGDVSETEAQRLAEKYFGSWSSRNKIVDVQVPSLSEKPARKIVIVDKPGAPQTALVAFGIGMPRSTPDYPASNVMNSVLGGLFSSRINMNLREKNGFTYGAFSEFLYYRSRGPFLTGALVRTDITASAAKELFSELERIRKEAPTPDELKIAEDYALQSLPGQFETAKDTSRLINDLFVYNLPANYYQMLPAKYLGLTPEEVEKTALDYIHPENLIVMAVGDRAKIEPGLKELGLGPIEVRNESGDLVKE